MLKKVKYKLIMFFLSFGCTSRYDGVAQSTESPAQTPSTVSFYSLSAKTLTGETFPFEGLRGKKVLIVNTASECGYTPQFEELQKLHEQYGAKLVVLGFPCNQFGGQDPGSNEEIGAFCKKNYGVSFQMFEKVEVKGANAHPVYKWLTNKTLNGVSDKVPSWNFGKYLISEKGDLIDFYGSNVSPLDKKLVDKIVN